MKKATYKPKDDNFEGSVEIEYPSLRQRLKYMKLMNFTTDDNASIQAMNNVDAMEQMFTITEMHAKKVTLKHKDGKKYKSFKEMSECSLCDDICQDIIKVVIEGSLGND